MTTNPWGRDLLRSPDVTDENGQVLEPKSSWRVAGALRARIVGSFLELDAQSPGLDFKESVRAATTAALPANTRTGNVLTASANGALAAQDGVTLIVGDSLLVKNEAAGANNGIYTVTSLGSGSTPWVLTRRSDADESTEVKPGFLLVVEEGTVNADTVWVHSTNAPVVLNTTALTFSKFSSLAAPANPGDNGKVAVASGGTLTYVDNLDVPGTLEYGGISGPRVITLESSVTVAAAAATTLLLFDPTVPLGSNGQVTVVAAVHARQASTGVHAFFERKARIKIASGTVTQVGTTEEVGTEREAGAVTDNWTCTIDVSGGAIRVRFTNPGWNTGEDVSVKTTVEYAGSSW